MQIAICDDNIKILDFLEQEIMAQFHNHFSISRYEDTGKLLDDWQNSNKHADIIIMDIKFQTRNGVDVARYLQEKYGSHIKIIFITGYPEHASEIFRAQPTFLLMKPISRDLLHEALVKAETLIEEENQNAIYISFRGCTKKIMVSDIYYVESERKKVIINYINGQIETIQKLNEIEKQLPDFFLRVHQSFLINLNFIESVSSSEVQMINGAILPISRSKSKYAHERFFEFLSSCN